MENEFLENEENGMYGLRLFVPYMVFDGPWQRSEDNAYLQRVLKMRNYCQANLTEDDFYVFMTDRDQMYVYDFWFVDSNTRLLAKLAC